MAFQLKKTIKVDFGNTQSIKNAERNKARLEKFGFNLAKTKQTGLNKFELMYERLPQISYAYTDDWGRPVYTDKERRGVKYVGVDGMLHTMTKQGEPLEPIHYKED